MNVLAMEVEWLGLKSRPYNCVKNNNIQTVGELIEWTPNQLLRNKNFGRASLKQITDELARLGVKLKSD